MMMHAPHIRPPQRRHRPRRRAHRTALALLTALATVAGLGIAGSFTAPATQATGPAENVLPVDPAKPEVRIEMRHHPSESDNSGATLPEGAKAFRIELPKDADGIGLHSVRAMLFSAGGDTILDQEAPFRNGHIRIDLSQLPEPLTGSDYRLEIAPAQDISPHTISGDMILHFTGPAGPAGKELVIQAAAEGRDPRCTVEIKVTRSWKTEMIEAPTGTPMRIQNGYAAVGTFSDGSPIRLAFEILPRPTQAQVPVQAEGNDLVFTMLQPDIKEEGEAQLVITDGTTFSAGERLPSSELLFLFIPVKGTLPEHQIRPQAPDAKMVTLGEPAYTIKTYSHNLVPPSDAPEVTLYLPELTKDMGLRELDVTIIGEDGTQLAQQRTGVQDAVARIDGSILPSPSDGKNYTIQLNGHDIAPHSFTGNLQVDVGRAGEFQVPTIDVTGKHDRDIDQPRAEIEYIMDQYTTDPVEVRHGDQVLIKDAAVYARRVAGRTEGITSPAVKLKDPATGFVELLKDTVKYDHYDYLVTIPEHASGTPQIDLKHESLYYHSPKRIIRIVVPLIITS